MTLITAQYGDKQHFGFLAKRKKKEKKKKNQLTLKELEVHLREVIVGVYVTAYILGVT